MQSYSDIIYLMAAMVVFSMLSMQASRMILINDRHLVESEVEYHAVSLGQDYIDQIQWFKTENQLNNFVADYPKMVNMEFEDGRLPFYVNFEVEDYTLPNSNVTSKLITIVIKSQYIGNQTQTTEAENSPRAIRLKFLKNFN